MNPIVGKLLCLALNETDARILMSELHESYCEKLNNRGRLAANLWLAREIIQALLLGVIARLSKSRRTYSIKHGSDSRNNSLGELLRTILGDIQFGIRTLRKRPLFFGIAVTTMGLGIGSSSAIFSVVEAVLLRPLPYERPGELVQVWETFPDWRDNPQLASGWDKVYLAWPDYARWRDGQTAFREVAIYGSTAMTLTGHGIPERIQVGTASSSLLSVLGVSPIMGRRFLPGEDGPDAEKVVLLGYNTWRDRYGSDPEQIGRTVSLNNEPFTVVGVLPQGFRVRGLGIFEGSGDYEVWIPVGANNARLTAGSHSYDAVARLKEGISIPVALAETENLLRGNRSPSEMGARIVARDELEDAGLREPLYLLFVASTVLLVIACGNVALLLVGEFSARRSELATRMSVGAGRGRLLRLLLTESVLLGLAGSVVGGFLAAAGTQILVGLAPQIPRLDQVGVNLSVVVFGACVGIVSGLFFGSIPALGILRGKIHNSLRRGSSGDSDRKSLVPFSIVAGELGLTAVLLVSAGLLVRSLDSLLTVDTGFHSSTLAQVTVRLPGGRYADAESRISVYTQMADELAAIPGVSAASGTSSLPFLGYPSLVSFGIEGQAEPEGGSRHLSPKSILPGYFETMGVPILEGRSIIDRDRAELGKVAVLSESMARRFWPGESPIGARILFGDTLTVVGIVGDVLHESMDAEYLPTMYVPLALDPWLSLTFVVRCEIDPTEILPQLRSAIWSVDSDTPITRVSSVESLIASSARDERFRTVLMMVFGFCAAALAGAGVFGVTARSVTFRRREMGIRMAMGAKNSELVRLALGRTCMAGLTGLGLGLVGALWISQLFDRFLFGIESWDPATYSLSAILLLGLGILASYLPARRATKIDPVEVMKAE